MLLKKLAAAIACPIVCEPRHESWCTPDAEALLAHYKVARVAADPPKIRCAELPGGWSGVRYYRLHGSPKKYYSSYDQAELITLQKALTKANLRGVDTWCIFDNTASSAAAANALELQALCVDTAPAGA